MTEESGLQETIDDLMNKLDRLPVAVRQRAVTQIQAIFSKNYGSNAFLDTISSKEETATSNIPEMTKVHSLRPACTKSELSKEKKCRKTTSAVPPPRPQRKATKNGLQNLSYSTPPESKESNLSDGRTDSRVNIICNVELHKDLKREKEVSVPCNGNNVLVKMCNIELHNGSKKEDEDLPVYNIKFPVYENLAYVDNLSEEFDAEGSKEINVDIHMPSPCTAMKKETQCSTSQLNQCLLCSYTAQTNDEMTNHLLTHKGQRAHFCTLCGRSFKQASSLKVHSKRHYGQRDFTCDVCRFRTYTKMDMKRHTVQHTSERDFICHYCGKTFGLDSSLRSHIKSMHERANLFCCNKCSFTTYHRYNLQNHHRYQHSVGVYKFTCPVCKQSFQQKSTLYEHVRTHSGERPYSCKCGKSFAAQSRLTTHMKTVHAPRKFLCRMCNKVFQSTHHLTRHAVIHTKDKPYKCTFCKYACNAQGNLTKHVKNTHHMINYTYRKKKLPVDEDTEFKIQSVKDGEIATAEYLSALSANLGRTVTLDELKGQQQEKQKSKTVSKKEQEKNIKQSKLEHSYHLVDLLQNEILEEELVDNDFSSSDLHEIDNSQSYLHIPDNNSIQMTRVPILLPNNPQVELDQQITVDSIITDDNSINDGTVVVPEDNQTINNIGIIISTNPQNIYEEIVQDVERTESSILYEEIVHELYLNTESTEVSQEVQCAYLSDEDCQQYCQTDGDTSMTLVAAGDETQIDIIGMLNQESNSEDVFIIKSIQ